MSVSIEKQALILRIFLLDNFFQKIARNYNLNEFTYSTDSKFENQNQLLTRLLDEFEDENSKDKPFLGDLLKMDYNELHELEDMYIDVLETEGSGAMSVDSVEEIKYKLYPLILQDPSWEKFVSEDEKVINLDNGGKLIKGVNYHSQRDNLTDDDPVKWYNMCNLTSLAMLMEYLGIPQKYPDMQYEDELYKVADEMDMGGKKLWNETYNVYKDLIKKYSNDFKLYLIETSEKNPDLINKIKSIIDSGIPVIVSGDMPGGHLMLAVGYDKTGFIFHDPYGNRNTGTIDKKPYCTNTNGAFVHYDYGKWKIGEKYIVYLTNK